MSRQFKFLFTLSILLNLLLVGIVAGHVSHRLFIQHEPYSEIFSQIADALPPEKRPIFEDAMKRADQDTAELHDQLAESRKQAANIMKADAFDKDAYLAQVQRINKLRAQLIERKAEAITEAAGKLSAEDRAAMTELLRRPHQ